MKSSYHVNIPNSLISIVSLWSTLGSSSDPAGKEGLAHLFEHLFLHRTKKLHSRIEVLRKIDGLGLFFNAFTGRNTVQYYFLQRSSEQELAYNLLLEGIEEFMADQASLDREKEIVYQEQLRFNSTPSLYVWKLADSSLWPTSQLKDSGLGTKESVEALSASDVDNLKSKLFSKSNTRFLTVSSKRISDEMENKLNVFTELPKTESGRTNTVGTPESHSRIICEYRSLDTVFVVISFPLPPLENIVQDKLILDFIKSYLASGWSSKLVERLRTESNYTYWVYGRVESFLEAGYFRISFSAKTKHVAESISIVIGEILQLCSEELSKEQLTHHKTAMKAHFLKNYIQPENMLSWYGWNFFLAKRAITIGEYLDSIDSIKPEQVRDSARKYLTIDKLHVALLGDISQEVVEPVIY